MAIRYPSEFTAGQATDYLQIQRLRRNYGAGEAGTGSKGISAASSSFTFGESVILNVPQRIVETFGQNWRHSTLGPEAAGLFYNTLQGTGLAGAAARRVAEKFLMDVSISALGKIGASNIAENSILSGTSGIIYNPNMEVLYDGPQFRQFNFQFVLFAKSEKDAQNIHQIVRFFQQASVPSSNDGLSASSVSTLSNLISSSSTIEAAGPLAQSAASAVMGGLKGGKAGAVAGGIPDLIKGTGIAVFGGLGANFVGNVLFNDGPRFIKQPPFIQLTFKRGANQHPYILPTKPCVINSLSVDYTPSGNYTVLNNFGQEEVATTVVTTISLSLTEIKTVFAEDYDSNGAYFGGAR